MKKLINLLLRSFGYEVNPRKSLILLHMDEVTHGTWMEDLIRNNRISDYHIKH